MTTAHLDPADLIAAHTAGAADALADSIRHGGQKVEAFPVSRPVPSPTLRDEAVAALFPGFLRLRAGR